MCDTLQLEISYSSDFRFHSCSKPVSSRDAGKEKHHSVVDERSVFYFSLLTSSMVAGERKEDSLVMLGQM